MRTEKWPWTVDKTVVRSFNSDHRLIAFSINIKSKVNSNDFNAKVDLYEYKIVLDGVVWSLDLYPNNLGYVGFQLILAESDLLPIPVKVSNCCGNEIIISREKGVILTADTDYWGWKNWKKQNQDIFEVNTTLTCTKMKNFSPNYNPMDSITIICEPWIIPDTFSLNEVIKIKGNDWDLWVHENVLKYKSSVFRAMLTHDMREKRERSIEILEFDKEPVYSMLQFLLAGRIELKINCLEELARLSHKYDIELLKQICDYNTATNINLDNVCCYLSHADLYDLRILKENCMDFIKKNYKEVVNTSAWEEITGNKTLVTEITRAMANLFNSKEE